MAARDEITTVAPQPDRFRQALVYYEVALSVWMMALGLWRWAIIVGLYSDSFTTMDDTARVATTFLAAADLVAAVGLWMRVPWGRVIYIAAVLAEVVLHTVFIATYGSTWGPVTVHLVALLVYAGLAILARRQPANTA